MNVLFFSNTDISTIDIKGTGNWIQSLIESLLISKKNIKICVAFHDKNVRRVTFYNNNNVKIAKIPIAYTSNRMFKILQNWNLLNEYKNATMDYLEIVSKVKPDIIQIFGLESPFIRIIDLVSQPILVHIQGLLAPYMYKNRLRIKSRELLFSNSIKNNIVGYNFITFNKKMSKHLKLEKRIYHKCKYFLGRTDWDRRCVKAFAPQARYFYCQEIMRQSFYKIEWQKPNNNKFIFYTTIVDGFFKNVDMIFEVSFILEKYHKNLSFEWHIGGVSDHDKISKIMKKRGIIPKNLKLLGRLNSQEIIKELLNANLFIYPSAIENGCNAVQEAMLCGIPIVATHAGGLSTTIEDKKTGVLVQEGDPYVLAGAIIEMLENEKETLELGKNARQIAHKRHLGSTIVENLINIYEKVLSL